MEKEISYELRIPQDGKPDRVVKLKCNSSEQLIEEAKKHGINLKNIKPVKQPEKKKEMTNGNDKTTPIQEIKKESTKDDVIKDLLMKIDLLEKKVIEHEKKIDLMDEKHKEEFIAIKSKIEFMAMFITKKD